MLDANFDTEAMVDPLFKQTTQRFDEMSMGSLLTSRLAINSELLIQLDSSMPQLSSSEYSGINGNMTYKDLGLQ